MTDSPIKPPNSFLQKLMNHQSPTNPDNAQINGINSQVPPPIFRSETKEKQLPIKTHRTLVDGLMFSLGFLLLFSLILGVVAFSRPAYVESTISHTYTKTGTYAYAGNAPPDLYDQTAIRTGDPIFPKYTCEVFIQFDFMINSAQTRDISGEYQLSASIIDQQSGWKKSVPLQDQSFFEGSTFSTIASFNLCGILDTVQDYEQKTDMRPSSYLLNVEPNIIFTGTANNIDINDTFNEPLTFQFNHNVAYIIPANQDIFHPTEEGFASTSTSTPNLVYVFGTAFHVAKLRTFAVITFMISILALVGLVVYLQFLSQKHPAAYQMIKLGSHISEIEDLEVPQDYPVIYVASIEDLTRIAERNSTTVLRKGDGTYVVMGYHHIYIHKK